jgi:hypothetical protein
MYLHYPGEGSRVRADTVEHVWCRPSRSDTGRSHPGFWLVTTGFTWLNNQWTHQEIWPGRYHVDFSLAKTVRTWLVSWLTERVIHVGIMPSVDWLRRFARDWIISWTSTGVVQAGIMPIFHWLWQFHVSEWSSRELSRKVSSWHFVGSDGLPMTEWSADTLGELSMSMSWRLW